MINFINNKKEQFNNIINKEIKNIFTDEHNENIKELSNLLNEFNYYNDKNKFNEMFMIFNKSILNSKEILENIINLDKKNNYIDKYILYDGQIIKGTTIKNGKGIEYQINKDNIIYEGEYLKGKRWNGKGKEYYDYGKLRFEGEYLNGERNGKEKNII